MENSCVYSSNHDVDVPTKLPMNVLCYNNILYNVCEGNAYLGTIVELDDKSITVICDMKLVSSVETLLDVESNRLDYGVVRNNRYSNSLKIRVNPTVIKTTKEQDTVIIRQLYVANIIHSNTKGILFLVSDKIVNTNNNAETEITLLQVHKIVNYEQERKEDANFDIEDLKESIYVARMHWYTDRSVEENLHNTIHIAIKNLDIETLVDMLYYTDFNGKYVYDITRDDYYLIKYAMTSSTEEVVIWIISRISKDNMKPQCPRDMILQYIGDDYQLIVEFIQRIQQDCKHNELVYYLTTWLANGSISYDTCKVIVEDIDSLNIPFIDLYT